MTHIRRHFHFYFLLNLQQTLPKYFGNVYLQDGVGHTRVAVAQHDTKPDGDERAAQCQDDGAEGHEVDHGRVDPCAAVDPQAQRHQHQRQERGRDGHDDAVDGETRPSNVMHASLHLLVKFNTVDQTLFRGGV